MEQIPPTKSKGGRPKGNPDSVKNITIGVRVSPSEFETLEGKAKSMGMFPAQWLREAALTRRLPSPPVPAINIEQYAELARLAANLNQLAKHANAGRMVSVNDELLRSTTAEVQRLRQALLGNSGGEE